MLECFSVGVRLICECGLVRCCVTVDKSKLTEADPDGDAVNDSGVYEHL